MRVALTGGLALFLAAEADAMPVNTRVCARYAVDLDDVTDAAGPVGDDYLTEDTSAKPAYGARLRVVDCTVRCNAVPVFDGYASSGAYPGCTPSTLALDTTHNYRVTVYADAEIGGDRVKVWNEIEPVCAADVDKAGYNTGPVHSETFYGWSPTLQSFHYLTTSVDEPWNIAAVAGFSRYRLWNDLPGNQVYRFKYEPGGSSCQVGVPSTGSAHVGLGRIRIGNVNPFRKYLIAHEKGHGVQHYARGGSETIDVSFANDPSIPVANDACAPRPWNQPLKGHEFNGREYQSTASHEGFAHFYSALAFNSTTTDECYFEPYKDTDWNLDGGFTASADYCSDGNPNDGVNYHPNGTYDPNGGDAFWNGVDQCYMTNITPTVERSVPASCAYKPVTNPPAGYLDANPTGTNYLAWCSAKSPGPLLTLTTHHGVEYDWMRFFWDLSTYDDIPVADILAVYGAAQPSSWLATETTNSTLYNCYPSRKLQSAASALDAGLGSAWALRSTQNGINTAPSSGTSCP